MVRSKIWAFNFTYSIEHEHSLTVPVYLSTCLSRATRPVSPPLFPPWCVLVSTCNTYRSTQVRIQDLVKGGAPGAEAESCRRSEAELRERSEQFVAGVQGPLKGPGSFWVFNTQICILPHSKDFCSHFWHLFQHQKLIKIEHYIVLQSIWNILIYYTYYLIFMKKLCFD